MTTQMTRKAPMPPARSSGRASRACSLCRKHKTRCHLLDKPGTPCLRCQTLRQPCSLASNNHPQSPDGQSPAHPQLASGQSAIGAQSVDERLQRLEAMVAGLGDRLDSLAPDAARTRLSTLPVIPDGKSHSDSPAHAVVDKSHSSVPVLLIRDAATDAGVHSPDDAAGAAAQSDVISSGLVPVPTAQSLLQLFRLHYGRWVRLPDDVPIDAQLTLTRRSPLLLSSILLIAVRHTTQELADRLAPALFREARRLLMPALLEVPQPIEYFQAALVLSLWSTTIAQTPLSIDSWLLTTYALRQAVASPVFSGVLDPGADPNASSGAGYLDAWCIWNHLCVAHLQYCVGTRRQSVLGPDQVAHCARIVDADDVGNYEVRMAAEAHLYWVIYQNCSATPADVDDAKASLESWRRDWATLFRQPRSQFLQMGFHFAHLLAYRQSLKTPSAMMDDSVLGAMIHHASTAIILAMDTTDDRTRHLTDHIYHILTFAALSICRLVHAYEPQLLRSREHDLASLEDLLVGFVRWLRNIGLPCHAAHMLGDVVAAQLAKVRTSFRLLGTVSDVPGLGMESPPDFSFVYPDFIGSEFLDADSQSVWPQWSEVVIGQDLSGVVVLWSQSQSQVTGHCISIAQLPT